MTAITSKTFTYGPSLNIPRGAGAGHDAARGQPRDQALA